MTCLTQSSARSCTRFLVLLLLGSPLLRAADGFDVVMGAYLNGALPSTDPAESGATAPATLSATGAFSNVGLLSPAAGVITYSVNSPLWSDGAMKRRWIAIPNDGERNLQSEKIDFNANEPWTFPAGTVAIKHFELSIDDSNIWVTKRLETRFLVALGNNEFYGLTYRWRADGSEADLLADGASTSVTITQADGTTRQQQWDFPSPSDCRLCHNVGGGVFLGLNTWQLNGYHYYGESNTGGNQLERWDAEGLFDELTSDVEDLPRAVAVDDESASLEHRSRSYLAANCANCHNDDSTSDLNADFDLNFTTPLQETRMVNADPLYSLGIVNAAIVRAGSAEESVLYQRMNTTNVHKMPPIGRNVIDSSAVSVIADWIATVTDEDAGQGGDDDDDGPIGSSRDIAFADSSHLLPDSTSASGVAMGVTDMNNDGKDDIIRLKNTRDLSIDYQEDPGGEFTSLYVGNASFINQWGMAIGDTDNNGYPEIITGGYFDGLHYFQANSNGSSYTKTTFSNPSIFLQAINFVDIDDDGLLDIFACHDIGSNATFRNTGNGVMSYDSSLIDTSTTPASDNSGNYGSVWTDYDGDGDLDLYISKCRAGVSSRTDPRRVNQLFRNNGDGSFSEVAAEAGLDDGAQSWTADFADIDNDGDLDVFIGNHMEASRLLTNDGDGTFTEVTTSSEISITWKVIQSVFRDFNNDGWVDLLVTGAEQELWLNDGDSTFTLAENPFGANAMESCAVGDLNSDGFPDVYAGYARLYNTPQTSKPDKLFLSESNGNGFLSIRLKGVSSNRLASGARLELYGPWGVQVREVRSGEGYGVTHSFAQTFGLGGYSYANRLVIRWPSGEVDEFENVAGNQFLTIEEGDSVAVGGVVLDESELARAFGSLNGEPSEQRPLLLDELTLDGSPVSCLTFLTQSNGQIVDGEIQTSDYTYRPECSLDLENWFETLVPIGNPSNTPAPPSGYEYRSFRMTESHPRAFFRVEVRH